MDSFIDIQALRSTDKLRAQGEAIAEALAVYYKLKKKSVETDAYDKDPFRLPDLQRNFNRRSI